MTTWVDIDRAYSTPNGVFAPLSDVRGPIEVGDVVNVQEKTSRKSGGALVTSIDEDNVYLSLAWNTLTDAYSARGFEAGYRYAKLIAVEGETLMADCGCRPNGVHDLGDDDCHYSPPGWTVGAAHLLAVADAAVVESARRRAERNAADELARLGQDMRLDD